jgi:hypothetical protein
VVVVGAEGIEAVAAPFEREVVVGKLLFGLTVGVRVLFFEERGIEA